MITGYGPINKTLNDRNCVQSADCPTYLGVAESVEHMLHYPLYNDFRSGDYEALAVDGRWTGLFHEDKCITFSNYVTDVFKTRKEYLTTLDSDSPPPWLEMNNLWLRPRRLSDCLYE